MSDSKRQIVTGFAKMWPRMISHLEENVVRAAKASLSKHGVYVLYQNDQPYYIGKSSDSLFKRVSQHDARMRGGYHHPWNFFSAFVVSDKRHLRDVEAILIAASPSKNKSKPRIKPIKIPREVDKVLRDKLKSRL